MYAIQLFRVNPLTRCCDGSGRISCFYSQGKLYELLSKAKNAFRLNFTDFCDFDSDVYLIKIINLKTKKEHIVV